MIVTVPGPADMTVVAATSTRPAHFADTMVFHIPDDVSLSRLVKFAGGDFDAALAAYADDGTLIQVQTKGALATSKGRRHATRTGSSQYRAATPEESTQAIAAARRMLTDGVEEARLRYQRAVAEAAADNAILDKIEAWKPEDVDSRNP